MYVLHSLQILLCNPKLSIHNYSFDFVWIAETTNTVRKFLMVSKRATAWNNNNAFLGIAEDLINAQQFTFSKQVANKNRVDQESNIKSHDEWSLSSVHQVEKVAPKSRIYGVLELYNPVYTLKMGVNFAPLTATPMGPSRCKITPQGVKDTNWYPGILLAPLGQFLYIERCI